MKNLKKIAGKYHARVQTPGRTKFISTGCTTLPEAEQVLKASSVAQLNTAAKAGRLTQKAIGQILTGKNLTCTKALATYGTVMATSKAPKTIANVSLTVTNWLKAAGIESLPPSAVTAHHIARWVNDPAASWKRSYRLVLLGGIKTFFEFCASQGWIVANPAQQVELDYAVLSHEQKETLDKQPFTGAEVERLLKELGADWQLAQADPRLGGPKPKLFHAPQHILFWLVAVQVAAETGLRLSDIAQLEWRCFGELDKLVVWADKTNRRTEHPISGPLQQLISEIPVSHADYLFPEQRALIRNNGKRAGLSVQFGRLCAKLEIAGKSFHSLRHYKATNAYAKLDKDALAKKLAESLSLEQIAALLGHANQKTTKGYIH